MRWETWLAFAGTALIMGALPGPGVANIVGYAIHSGRRTAFVAVTGAVAGSVISMLLSLSGAGVVLQSSAIAYRLLQIGGGIYLILLGLAAIRASLARQSSVGGHREKSGNRSAFLASVAVSATNPKSILFFVALAPQFIDGRRAYSVQALILIATFAAAITLTDSVYALLATRVVAPVRSQRAATLARAGSGFMLIAIGIVALAEW